MTYPTETGCDYPMAMSVVVGTKETAREAAIRAANEFAGSIRLSAPLSFDTAYLFKRLAKFAAMHPAMELDISFDDRLIDLASGGGDGAIRISAMKDSSLIARNLARLRAYRSEALSI